MHVDGSCHCGKITFEAEIDGDQVGICHCADCQTFSSSAFRITVPTPEAAFRLLTGTPKLYIKQTADSGRPRVQAFCADCGSALYATAPSGENRIFGIRVGVLRQRADLVPRRQIWCQSKLSWLPELPGEEFPREGSARK
jgi:hypothetical protein